jgi:hypothetical protein
MCSPWLDADTWAMSRGQTTFPYSTHQEYRRESTCDTKDQDHPIEKKKKKQLFDTNISQLPGNMQTRDGIRYFEQ